MVAYSSIVDMGYAVVGAAARLSLVEQSLEWSLTV